MNKQLLKIGLLLFFTVNIDRGYAQNEWHSLSEASDFLQQTFAKMGVGSEKIPDETLNPEGVDIDFSKSFISINSDNHDFKIDYSTITYHSSGRTKKLSCYPETTRNGYDITFNQADVDFVTDTGYVVKKWPELIRVLWINLKKGKFAQVIEGGLGEKGKFVNCALAPVNKIPLYYNRTESRKEQLISAFMYASYNLSLGNTRLFFEGKTKNAPSIEDVNAFLSYHMTQQFQTTIRMEGFILGYIDNKPYQTIDFNRSGAEFHDGRAGVSYSTKTKGRYLPLPCDSTVLGTSEEYDFYISDITSISEEETISEQQGVKVGMLLINLNATDPVQVLNVGIKDHKSVACLKTHTGQVPVYYDQESPKEKEYIVKALNYLIKNKG